MVFNSNSDGQDIVSLIGDQTGIDTTNEIKQITRAANKANKQIWAWIFDAFGGWQYDDGNNTNLPSSKADLVADQEKYTLPSEALVVRGMEYMDSGNTWHKLHALSIDEINQKTSEQEFFDTSGEPRYYSLVNGIVKLYPASDTSRNQALRMQYDRGSVSFASTDTTKTPGFASEFHEAVATGASMEIARNNSLPQLEALMFDWREYEDGVKKFYNKRYSELFPHEIKNTDYARLMQ